MRNGLAVVVVTFAALLFGAGSATAACDKTWTGGGGTSDWFTAANWQPAGVPGSTDNVCIPDAGSPTVVIDEAANPGTAALASSLTLGGSTSGQTATLEIQGDSVGTSPNRTGVPAELDLGGGGATINGDGVINLTTACSPSQACTTASATLSSAGTITNGGTIDSEAGTAATSGRTLAGSLDNRGTIMLAANLRYNGGTLTNDSGGLITNGSGSSQAPVGFVILGGPAALTVDAGTFDQGAGTTDPSGSTDPGTVSPAVVVDRGALDYTGTGTSAISIYPGASLSGDIHSAQELLIIAIDIGCGSSVTDASALANAGTLVFGGGSGYGCLQVGGGTGTLTNTGTIVVTHSQVNNEPREINGSLDNTSGNLELGSAAAPAPLTVTGSYTQGSGGTLTVPIAGTTTAGQLVAGGSSLNGALAIETSGNFTPQTGDTFKILDDGTATATGRFSVITGQFPSGSGSGYEPLYDPSDVTLSYEARNGLSVTLAGKGHGTVGSAPSGITCPSTCSASYFADQVVTLTAAPTSGSKFAGWSGDCTGTSTACQVATSQARSVTATFQRITTTALTSSKNPVTVHHSVTYEATVGPAPDGGTVKFTDNGRTIPGCAAKPVNSTTGKATCSITYGSAAKHTIAAIYSGDGNYANSRSKPLSETVKA